GGAGGMCAWAAAPAAVPPLDAFLPNDTPSHLRTFDQTPAPLATRARTGLRKTGERFPVEASISRRSANRRRFFTVVVRDVTERRKLEDQVRQAQKMEAVG